MHLLSCHRRPSTLGTQRLQTNGGGADTPSCSLWSASASLLTSTPDCSPAFDMGRGVSCLLKQDTYRELLGSSSGKLKGREESVCRTARS